ncbi:N-acetyltransferase [Protaetiibacter sp. SSC-01]|uniref:GNAT family N-acetyltransferase n=1 Tax=Protaetiibacter sp. SSC-01 TaxID=2759943 RepID=UPI001656D13D|nr:GNAT family N-acetyltransferase [Protaetiibacter sp. SSC-01]QNO38113.1 N-acetyltransferase [Protaetiibacter sp. SSC-01]
MQHESFEYPDTAGYPDGMGFLDEGTASALAAAGSVEFLTPSAEADVDLRVLDDPQTQEYRAIIGDREVGVIRYAHLGGGPTVLRSTYVDPQLRGFGIGTAFIAHVLDERMERGERVIVECPMIRRFVEAHGEYAGVVVR